MSKSEDGEIKASVAAVEWLPKGDTKAAVQEPLLLHAHNSIFPLHRHFSPLSLSAFSLRCPSGSAYDDLQGCRCGTPHLGTGPTGRPRPVYATLFATRTTQAEQVFGDM